jgi:hypothetical protein
MFLKVIACEIAFREICFVAAQTENLIDLEFLTQGLHDHPAEGLQQVQQRIDAVPAGRYDAILVGYGLCGNIVNGLRARHTPLVIPRAHDCITFFLGTRERYQRLTESLPGAYFYTSGWLECLRRRGDAVATSSAQFLPTRAGMIDNMTGAFQQWVQRYGEEEARYLMEVMDQWTANYTHGVLIDFDFTKMLHLREQVQAICAKRGWEFEEVEGDLRLLKYWVEGEWDPKMFLTLKPGEEAVPSYDDLVIVAKPPDNAAGGV